MSQQDHRQVRQARLTHVDRGTPMGEYQRRFWHPVAATIEFDKWPVKKVRLLGEDLALYRTENGTLGLVAERCPHRGASLACGMTDGSGLRCAYHGWLYDTSGKCVETPTEPATSKLKDRIAIAGYPVREMGGLVWAYLGPQPAPLLPRFEHLLAEGWNRSTGFTSIPCNWLQIAENTLDPLHVEQLHMKYTNWVRKQSGEAPLRVRTHAKVDYTLFEYGILKKRLWVGDPEDSDEWLVGHPLIFPGTLLFPYNADYVQYQFRVPVDNENTIVYWYHSKRTPEGETPTTTVPIWENPFKSPEGEFIFGNINAQDMMVWITQGPITDHALEHLGESDRGVALYRKTLHEQVDRVERGEDPMGVIRDPAKNTPYIQMPIERHVGYDLGEVNSRKYAFTAGR